MSELLRKLDDPEIDKIKINCNDYFELVYLRHKYFRKSTNPTPQRLAQFEEMICNISDKIYLRNIIVFKTVGFEMDDLRNIGRIHTVSFISMGGLDENPDKMEKFRIRHKKLRGEDSEPSDTDIFLKECYDLAKFLNQRLQEDANFSKIKNSNIRGTRSTKSFYVGDSEKNPTDNELLQSANEFGYRKITEVKWKKLVEENNVKNKIKFLNKDNETVRVVYKKGSFLTKDDITGTELDPSNSFYYKSPEDNLISKETILQEDFFKIYKK